LGEQEGKLEEILQCKDLTKYLPRTSTDNGNTMEFADKASLRETVTSATCPPDILKQFRAKTPNKIAINLIRQQYNIRYNSIYVWYGLDSALENIKRGFVKMHFFGHESGDWGRGKFLTCQCFLQLPDFSCNNQEFEFNLFSK